ncbi:MAG: hypothetical protein FWD37_01080 [Methanomassiliicoccaceae archaeon]|nr:hypothetical protein [Methanomassiliicoccaceae archaeon]
MPYDLKEMTFEDLSSVYRLEKASRTLTDVREDLYPALLQLQDSIHKSYESERAKDPDSIICEGLGERRKKVSVILQRIVDLRMEKIILLALRTSMGSVNVIDKLTKEERDYYHGLVEVSKKHLATVVRDKGKRNYVIPDISLPEEKAPAETPQTVEAPITVSEEQEEVVLVRILEDLPVIPGPDRDYDLKKETVVTMPLSMANVLINHEKAVLLNITH